MIRKWARALQWLQKNGYKMTAYKNKIKYDLISEAIEGEIESGDKALVKINDNNILIAVADGLGHGQEAALAAKMALQSLSENADKPLIEMVELCNASLVSTRGVVLSVAKIDAFGIHYLSVGNIASACWKKNETGTKKIEVFLSKSGIVGENLPILEPRHIMCSPGDILMFASDGIDPAFIDEKIAGNDTANIAKNIFAKYKKSTDDVLLLVAQLL